MKILITTDLFKPQVNGVVISITNLIKELEKRGHEVRVLTFSQSFHSKREGNVYYVKSLPLGVYPGVRFPVIKNYEYIKEIMEWHPDIIHSQCEFFSYTYGKKISKKLDVPLVHTFHTLYEQYISNYLLCGTVINKLIFPFFLKNRLRSSDMLIAPSDKVEKVLNTYQLDKDVEIVPTGIELDSLNKKVDDDSIVALRKQLGIKSNEKVILSLGRLGFEKCIDEIIDGFSKSSEQILLKSKLIIVGNGPAKKFLEKYTKEKGVTDRVIFTGAVAPELVGLYYQLADVFVNASTSETQGLTYLEAYISGLPLVCKKDLCSEQFAVNSGGSVFTNEYEMVKEIEKILDKDNEMAQTLRVARHSSAFGTEIFAEKIEEVYYKTIDIQNSRNFKKISVLQ